MRQRMNAHNRSPFRGRRLQYVQGEPVVNLGRTKSGDRCQEVLKWPLVKVIQSTASVVKVVLSAVGYPKE